MLAAESDPVNNNSAKANRTVLPGRCAASNLVTPSSVHV